MNSLYIFVLIASFLLAVEAKKSKGSPTNSDECKVQFPNGFFCSSVCQKWPVLKGITVMCFVSNDGEYYRFIGRNPTYGVWRFYKVNETTDEKSLCQATVNGDKFYLNRTDTLCPTRDSNKRNLRQLDVSTSATEEASQAEMEHSDLSTEPTPSEKNLSLIGMVKRINEQIKNFFKQKTQGVEEVIEHPKHRSSFAADRVESIQTQKQKTLPTDEICELLKSDVIGFKKIITCEKDENCCWDHFEHETVTLKNMDKYDECHKAISVAMNDIL